MAETNQERGLQCLSDIALAQIIESDVETNGELKSHEACVAFEELERRSSEL